METIAREMEIAFYSHQQCKTSSNEKKEKGPCIKAILDPNHCAGSPI